MHRRYRAHRREEFSSANIGLLAGTKLSTGRLFGFIDIDDDRLVPFVREVAGPVSVSKRGPKSLTIFCQVEASIKNANPSGKEHGWIDGSLLEAEHSDLPILTSVRARIISEVVSNPHAKAIIEGGLAVKALSDLSPSNCDPNAAQPSSTADKRLKHGDFQVPKWAKKPRFTVILALSANWSERRDSSPRPRLQ